MKLFKAFLVLLLMQWATVVYGRVLHFSNYSLNLQDSCSTDHKLNVQIGNELYCAPLTTTWSDNSLHVEFGGTTYTVCDGTCPSGQYVMPATPPPPEQLSTSCTWTQTNANAYLISDGNQYFDTGFGPDNSNEVEITAKIVNGENARLYGTSGSTCFYDVTVDSYGDIYFRIGTSTYGTYFRGSKLSMSDKHTWIIKNHNSGPTKKFIYQDVVSNSGKLGQMNSYTCSVTTNTVKILKNDWKTISSNGGEIRLYSIKVWDKNGNLLHEYQPVAQGTNICGYTVPTNCLWDAAKQQVLLPGGTGQTGYGADQ